MKSNKVKKIDSNIAESFEIIDDYLPKRYVSKVLELVPDATESIIRQVKSRKSGDLKIIAALLKVAEDSKSILKK
ncbi:hypothetical protein EG346_15770 [Chryseobacterium carnipullorum]|uniref:Uncharacterized protein n=1 Tax=Chryseobacterium carnipullorum TaxID=1124835 RepID=A0A376DSD5_CHRCU|nr:hypothetical protein [Chryseobacterium carnipullorum]AZA49544.1 hypothetical protein EG346_15770 [Chryseobacterium carnipullorum]AZA64441.1 hypothetical protein EG345_06785 [Chryseobacterium carnipullorum]STC94772.1 Uncharacterised protein [Chryseobacterium carnipullorum]